jgi:hypothetical protein
MPEELKQKIPVIIKNSRQTDKSEVDFNYKTKAQKQQEQKQVLFDECKRIIMAINKHDFIGQLERREAKYDYSSDDELPPKEISP